MKRIFLPLLLLLLPIPLLAYIGPGAGFAFLGSFLFIFLAFFVALFNLLTFPIRALVRFIKRLKIRKLSRVKRVVVIGFDGMDYKLTKRLIKEGKLPNFARLAEEGTFAPLRSTEPPLSPVAWSTFSTGVNPGKHNIFDFLTRDPRTYMPKLASTAIFPPRRKLRIGNLTIPLSRPRIELLRKSKSFWRLLGERGIFSEVIRVPITFPPEKFYGTMLSGLGVPDLRGSQGTFTFFSEKRSEVFDLSEGLCLLLQKKGDVYEGKIPGPEDPFRPGRTLEAEFQLKPLNGEKAEISLNGEKIIVEKGKLSPWFTIKFKSGILTIRGIAQWYLHSLEPEVELYLSPINIDPERPSMPLSHPKIFSVYLSKLFGPYATLGMSEDTWGLNEGVLSEEGYLQQVYGAQRERERFLMAALDKVKEGAVVAVFEATDRVQHMFWRYMDKESPAPKKSSDPQIKEAVVRSYQRMDELLGRVMKKMGKDEVLIVVSDHGFNSFNREVHLNTWLYKNGYLALKEGKKTSGKWFADVDWTKTVAYAHGLCGIFLNLKGREAYGIVEPGQQAEKLKREIKERLEGLVDEEKGKKAIAKVFIREEIYKGPYVENAPDLIVGYSIGYRHSWESSVGYVGDRIFSDNTRCWSADHGFTSEAVPGIFFCNRKVKETKPTLADIAPTVLSLFGIKAPAYMDGKDLGVK